MTTPAGETLTDSAATGGWSGAYARFQYVYAEVVIVVGGVADSEPSAAIVYVLKLLGSPDTARTCPAGSAATALITELSAKYGVPKSARLPFG